MTRSSIGVPPFTVVVAACIVISLSALSASAQAPPSAKTPEHELLKKDVGTWDAVVKIFPPQGEPIESKATEKNELMEGGLWLITDFEGKIGDVPFKGHGTFGYDPVEKKYVGTWIDTMTPSLTIMKGDYDPETKTLTTSAQGREPESGETITYRQITKYEDDDTRTFEMYMPGQAGGEEWKMMEVKYKRRSE